MGGLVNERGRGEPVECICDALRYDAMRCGVCECMCRIQRGGGVDTPSVRDGCLHKICILSCLELKNTNMILYEIKKLNRHLLGH